MRACECFNQRAFERSKARRNCGNAFTFIAALTDLSDDQGHRFAQWMRQRNRTPC